MEQRRLYRVRRSAGATNSRIVGKDGWLWFLEREFDTVTYWKSVATGRETTYWYKGEMEPVD